MNQKLLPNLIRFVVVASMTALLSAAPAKAQTPQFYTAAVSSYNNFPFNGTTSSGNMCQFLYFPADFNTLPSGGVLITTIYFKAAISGSSTYTNLLLQMGNTSLTSLTSGTWNGGLTTVLSQSSLSSTFTSGTWYAFPLATPFFYSGGNLLVEASQASHTGTGMGVWYYSGSVNKRMYGTTTSASSTGADASPLSFGFDAIPATCSGTPLAPVITTPAMNASAPICAGSTYGLTATDPNAPISNITYQWQSSTTSATTGFTNVTSGTGATTLNYTTGSLPVTTWFRMGATCTNSAITTYSTAYQVLVGAPQPGAISGRPTFCPGDTANYNVPNVPGTIYTWTLPPTWTGTSTTNNILVTMGTSGGTVSVTATSSCGGPSVPRTKSVVAGSAPATPAVINGSNAVCAYSIQTYSIAPVVGAVFYTWTLPSGWTGTSTGPSITLTTDATSGTLMVKAGNGCGTSTDATLAINIINSLGTPAPITSSAVGGVYCTGMLYNFSINPVSGATSYQWILPTGWTGSSSGTTAQAFAGTSSGQIKVTAYVSCAISPTASLNTNVTTTVNPSVLISTTGALCQGVPITFTASPTNGGATPAYQWKKNGANVFSIGATYTDATLVTGDVIAVVLTSNATCRSADTIRSNSITANLTPSVTPGISINTTPVVTICAGTAINFTSTITGGGTTPTYQWMRNGLAVGTGGTGPTYNTAALVNGDTITVVLGTNAPCATITSVPSNKVGIKVNNVVVPTITVSPASVTAGSGPVTFTATQSGGGPTPQYQWIKNGVDISGATGSTYTASSLVGGDHITVRMQSYDPCADPGVVVAPEVIVEGATGIAGLNGWGGSVALYPNPVTEGRFTVAASWEGLHNAGERVTVDVLNVVGQSVYHSEVAPGASAQGKQWHYDVNMPAAAASGSYILRLSAPQSGKTANLPFVLNR